jgi:hypothetical protein
MFVQKICTFNLDEIVYWSSDWFLSNIRMYFVSPTKVIKTLLRGSSRLVKWYFSLFYNWILCFGIWMKSMPQNQILSYSINSLFSYCLFSAISYLIYFVTLSVRKNKVRGYVKNNWYSKINSWITRIARIINIYFAFGA